ncbi:MAG: 50S ribosomal protein L4 [Candidatus Margulisbacteria bacterium]|nr:50S ribosomal protein L4 [Candidatus Margulisiibacteriota bacterium]
MVKVNSYDLVKKQESSFEVASKLVDSPVSKEKLGFVVKDFLHQKRSKNSYAKTRAEVSGGGAKPWKQKGTGRARAGTSNSHLWVGGGVAMGPQNLKRLLKVNKKVKRQAFLGSLTAQKEIMLVVENSDKFSSLVTKVNDFVQIVKAKNINDKRILYVSKEKDSREAVIGNYNNLQVSSVYGLNVYDILKATAILIEDSAMKQLEEIYTK